MAIAKPAKLNQNPTVSAVTGKLVCAALMSEDRAPASTMMIATVAMISPSDSAWNPANHAAARRAPSPPQIRMSRYIGTSSRPQKITNSTKSEEHSTPLTAVSRSSTRIT